MIWIVFADAAGQTHEVSVATVLMDKIEIQTKIQKD